MNSTYSQKPSRFVEAFAFLVKVWKKEQNRDMIDPKNIDMNQLPKKFCDGAIGSFGRDLFAFAITSGNSLDSFAATPHNMKSIAIWLSNQIEAYEKQFGEIDMTPPKIQSPIQISDLRSDKN
jgi:hypothetical protein